MNDLALVFPPSRAITLIARCIYLAALVVAIFGEILACMHIHSIWGTPATLFAIFVFPVAPMVPIFSSGHWIPAAMTYGAFIAAYILCSIVFFCRPSQATSRVEAVQCHEQIDHLGFGREQICQAGV